MQKTILCACAAAAAGALAVLVAPPAAPARERPVQTLLAPGSRYLVADISRLRRETWHWQRLVGKRRTPTTFSAERSRKPSYRRWALAVWKRRAARARRQAQRPPHLRSWLCIHRHEGPWNDPRPPYYGGLQMDIAFQRRYAAWLLRRKGTADNWKPIEQIWIAERGRKVQGWHAWPNTARACGLI